MFSRLVFFVSLSLLAIVSVYSIQGEIISVGNGIQLENGQVKSLSVKPGDKVLFTKWSGTEIKLAGIDYLIMKESDILGIIE